MNIINSLFLQVQKVCSIHIQGRDISGKDIAKLDDLRIKTGEHIKQNTIEIDCPDCKGKGVLIKNISDCKEYECNKKKRIM